MRNIVAVVPIATGACAEQAPAPSPVMLDAIRFAVIGDSGTGDRYQSDVAHTLYSDGGRHGSQVDLRVVLEPLFVKYRVNVVSPATTTSTNASNRSGGIYYFVSGAAGQLRKGDLRHSDLTAAAFDRDQSFMLVEIAGADFSFQAVSRTGKTVDSGVIHKEVRS
jgi:hypothetical protein